MTIRGHVHGNEKVVEKKSYQMKTNNSSLAPLPTHDPLVTMQSAQRKCDTHTPPQTLLHYCKYAMLCSMEPLLYGAPPLWSPYLAATFFALASTSPSSG